MLERQAAQSIAQALAQFPAVAIIGPRQVGKTTLALALAQQSGRRFHYLDLESELDRAKLASPRLYLDDKRQDLVILDEVHRKPDLFGNLRGIIDESRRAGIRAGQYLLLGSASLDLLAQSGETLAGRVAYVDLSPLNLLEVPNGQSQSLWLRGGFPDSFLAASEKASLAWRRSFIRTYIERDLSEFSSLRIDRETFRRLWVMLANQQGSQANLASLSRSLGEEQRRLGQQINLLERMLLMRRLLPWHSNRGKRMVKTPKLYIRDSGLLHALLGIQNLEGLLSHPVVGSSWEGHVIENIAAAVGDRGQLFFYRSSGGAELDLVIEWQSTECWAIEIKRSEAPKPTRGFHSACEDLQPKRKIVITPYVGRWNLLADVEVMGLSDLLSVLP